MFLLIYLAITPHGSHRGAIVSIDLAAMVGSIVVVGPVGIRSLSSSWRDAFFFSWSAGTVVVIAVGLSLDGGAGGPIAGLLVLPVLFGGLLYNLRDAIGLAALAVLLPETSSDEAETLVERIRSRTLAAVTPERVTVSFGLSTWCGPGDSASELLRRADAALYEAKRDGRNRVAVWSASRTPPHP